MTGRLRVNRKNYEDCYVSGKPLFKRDINIPSMAARNRALDRDIVAVELLPRFLWRIMQDEASVRKRQVPEKRVKMQQYSLLRSRGLNAEGRASGAGKPRRYAVGGSGSHVAQSAPPWWYAMGSTLKIPFKSKHCSFPS